ncbi:hypothetical protein EAY42_19350 [Vibrio anguillarum]|nr:hypothetical protein [Vibrio anguillarum]
MKHYISLVILCLVSFYSFSDDAPKWVYPNGEIVPQSVQIDLAKKCKIEEAVSRIANVKEGEFDEAFALLIEASNCMTADGITIEHAHNVGQKL